MGWLGGGTLEDPRRGSAWREARRTEPSQSAEEKEKKKEKGEVGRGLAAGRGHDGPLRRLRAAHPGPLPAQRARPGLARQVRAVLRVQLQADRQVLLAGRKALLQAGLFPVGPKSDGKRGGLPFTDNLRSCLLAKTKTKQTKKQMPNPFDLSSSITDFFLKKGACGILATFKSDEGGKFCCSFFQSHRSQNKLNASPRRLWKKNSQTNKQT